MTRSRIWALPALALLLASGCSSSKTETTPSAPAPAKTAQGAALKIALLTTGPVDDGGWNQLAYTGILGVQKELGAQIAKQENLKPDQFQNALRDFANQGYDVVFAHGDEFSAPAKTVAAQFPKTLFVTSGGKNSGPNLMPIDFRTEEGSYLQGMQAALVSKTGKGGFLGGMQIPPVDKAEKAMENGAKAVNPKFQMQVVYMPGGAGVDPWNDPTDAKASTQTLLNNGVDVLAHNCDASAKGMFETAGAKPGVYTFGVNSDQNAAAPNVLSSVYLDFPKTYTDICRGLQSHTLKVEPLHLGLKEGDIKLIDNPKLSTVIPAAGKAKIEDAEKRIIAGTLNVNG